MTLHHSPNYPTMSNGTAQVTRANAIMERWIGGCRRELLDQTLIWNQRHLLRVFS
jgi:hypothetical protein